MLRTPLARIRYWLPVYLLIELAILVTLVRVQGVFVQVGMDFLPSFAGARMLIDGGRHDLYDTFLQWHRQQPIINDYGGGWTDRMVQPYVAPPQLAIITLPLLLVGPIIGWLVWISANLAAAVLAVRLLVRRLRIDWPLIASIVLASFPLFYTLLLGQVEGILLLALTVFVLELRRGNEGRAGLALAVLALKPQLLLVPLLFMVVTGRRRGLIVTLTAGAAQLVVSTLVVGISGMREYVNLGQRLSTPEGIVATNVPGMVNIRGAIVRALPWLDANLANVLILVFSLALLAVAVYLWRKLGALALSGPGIALLMTTLLLTSYHALYHTAVFATLAVVFLVEHAWNAGDESLVWRLTVGAWVGFALLPMLAFVLIVQSSPVPATIGTLAALGFWAVAVRQGLELAQSPVIVTAPVSPGLEPVLSEPPLRDS